MVNFPKIDSSERQSARDEHVDVGVTHGLGGEMTNDMLLNGFPAQNVALLVTAIGQLDEGLMITDPSATIQFVNAAFTRITGYGAEEAVGQNTRMLKSSSQNPAFYEKLWTTILSGKTWRGELIDRRKNGNLYTEEMSITPVLDASGAITSFIAIKRDVTDRRAAEAALRSSEKRMESVQKILPIGNWELDELATEMRGSDSFLRMFEWTSSVLSHK